MLKKFKRFKELLVKESKDKLEIKKILTSRLKFLHKFHIQVGFKRWKEAITIDENENSHINTIAYIANYNDGNEYSFEDFEVYDDDYDDDTNMKINTKINATKNVTKVHNGHSSNISSKSTIWREKVINSRKALQDKIYNNKQITK